ncbi:response regulator [bacterium]|nr:response regulator [bacterium]
MNEKILVVEDEDLVADDIIEGLSELGYEIVGRASTVEGTLDLAHEEAPDLVLMDINIEGDGDGIEAAEELRKRGIPVVFLTGATDGETLRRAKVTEPYGYIIKPYKEVDLRATIEIALHSSRASRPKNNTPATPEAKESEVHPSRSPSAQDPSSKEAFVFLSRIQQFQGLTEDQLQHIAGHARMKRHEAGELVQFEGEELDSGFIVQEGRVAFLKSSPSGKDLIVELLPPGDVFSLLVSLNRQPFAYSTRVQVESSLIWIPHAPLYEVFDRSPQVARACFGEVFGRLRRAHDFSRLLAHEKVEVRIASALVNLQPNFAVEEGDREVIRMTRQELAELTGTTQETCIRVTRALEKDGLLDLSESRAIKILNAKGLREVSLVDAI